MCICAGKRSLWFQTPMISLDLFLSLEFLKEPPHPRRLDGQKEVLMIRGSMSSRVGQDSYTVKLTSLVDMGIPISYNALAKRVTREFKNLHGHLCGKEVTVDPNFDDLSGLTSVTGVSEGAPTPAKAGRPKGSTDDKKRQDVKTLSDCIGSIAYNYSTEKQIISGQGKIVKRGFLTKLI